jgi:hypothetical protein
MRVAHNQCNLALIFRHRLHFETVLLAMLAFEQRVFRHLMWPDQPYVPINQSYFMPVSATTFDQRPASVLMKAANSAGVPVAG